MYWSGCPDNQDKLQGIVDVWTLDKTILELDFLYGNFLGNHFLIPRPNSFGILFDSGIIIVFSSWSTAGSRIMFVC
jgi:hypothetical protein